MPHTNDWDETAPTNATVAVNIDDEIRKLRLDARERLALDHDFASADVAADTRGLHTKVTLKEPIAAPTVTGEQTAIYRKTGDPSSQFRFKCKKGVSHCVTLVGEVRMIFAIAAPDGWLALDGNTIGDATSGATYAADAYEDLFAHLWGNVADAYAPVSGGRGASAAADWAAHKTLTMPNAESRVPMGAGTGPGLSPRVLGATDGAETINLSHQHAISGDTDVSADMLGDEGDGGATQGPSHTHPISFNSVAAGSAAQAILNPFLVFLFIIKF